MNKHPMHEEHRLRQLRGTPPPPIHDNSWVEYMKDEIRASNVGMEAAQDRLKKAREELAEAERRRYIRQAENAQRSAARWEGFAKFSLFMMASPLVAVLAGVAIYWTLKTLL